MRRRLSLVLSGLAALTLLTACSRISGGCPQGGGGHSRVFFDELTNISQWIPLEGDLRPPFRVIACAHSVCVEQEVDSWLPPILDVELQDVAEETSVTVNLKAIVTATGEVVFDARSSVDLVLYWQAIPGCRDAYYVARVALTPDGELVQTPTS